MKTNKRILELENKIENGFIKGTQKSHQEEKDFAELVYSFKVTSNLPTVTYSMALPIDIYEEFTSFLEKEHLKPRQFIAYILENFIRKKEGDNK